MTGAMQEADPRIGGKIQRLRRQSRISQAQLASSLGISASYLNLIEHNRRRMTVPLLLKTASYFGVDATELAENDDSRLAGDLMELFGDDLFADSDVTNQDVRDLASSNPQIGRANPIMGTQAKLFTHTELKQLAAYVASLPGELKTVPQPKLRR